MMSNETISVSRSALEILLQGERGLAYAQARHELRALLAQPAAQHQGNAVAARVCGYTPGLGQVELILPGNLPSWLELGETVTVRHGNVQHQGEPVAMVRTHGSSCWEEITGESLELCQSEPDEYEVRMLYTRPAEQPAPAAVVLPEQWLPIETAPKDETEIILRKGDRVTAGAWIEWSKSHSEHHSTTGEYLGQVEYDSGANWGSWDGGFREDDEPTHWQPLPAPPQQ